MEAPHIHPITLRFANPDREAAFRRYYFRRSLWLVRGAMLLGAVQYALFGILDRAMVPDVAGTIHVVRVVVCAYVVTALGVTFTRHFTPRSFQAVTASVPLVAGLGVAAFVAIGEDLNAYYDYYAGQMLILFYVHALLRLRFVWASAVSGVIIALYVAVSAGVAHTPGILLLNNTFFLLSANASGMIASYGLEYYARRVFIQTVELQEKQQLLEAEDARKSLELEAARRLQLAILPTALPEHPAAEWAASMRPAAEVGGDYYDWDVAPDGTVTIAIGDATGHGVQAGALVTATKSVLAVLQDEPDLAAVLRRATGPIRRAGAGKLFMALALARLRGTTLEMAGAGMPPALLYRAAGGTVEPLPLKGMPLGGWAEFPYTSTSIALEPGDTVAFMSDGLAELFDAEGGMFGYEEAIEAFREVAEAPPAAVVEHFNRTALSWHGAHPPSDDLTFLVLRLKPGGGLPERDGLTAALTVP